MAKSLKHVGKVKNTGSKVLVVFRTLPGESDKALVLPTATLPDIYHNSIMELVETDMAQQSYELGEIMFVRSFPDGRNMLQAMQADGRLQKVSTDNITMTPTPVSEIPLDQLNVLIAEQKNCTVDELCTFVKGATPANKKAEVQEAATVNEVPAATPAATKLQAADNTPLTDTDIAKSYRSQADALYKEAALLRKQADELDPPKRKAAKVSEDASA
jgi:hypothetical protein